MHFRDLNHYLVSSQLHNRFFQLMNWTWWIPLSHYSHLILFILLVCILQVSISLQWLRIFFPPAERSSRFIWTDFFSISFSAGGKLGGRTSPKACVQYTFFQRQRSVSRNVFVSSFISSSLFIFCCLCCIWIFRRYICHEKRYNINLSYICVNSARCFCLALSGYRNLLPYHTLYFLVWTFKIYNNCRPSLY